MQFKIQTIRKNEIKTANKLGLFLFVLFSFLCSSLQAYSKVDSPSESNSAEQQNKQKTEQKIYKSNVSVGAFQRIGTLSPITLKSQPEATEAIILIHGLNGVTLSKELYEWNNFWDFWLKSNIPNKQKYKLIAFRYDGWNSLYDSSNTLSQGIRQLLTEEPNIKSISFVGYSQGGIIARIILAQNPKINSLTRKVITTATPHLGTVVLTEKLVRDVLALQNPIVYAKNIKILKILKSRYKYAYYEQAWSDFDHGFPLSADYKPPQEVLNLPVPDRLNRFTVYASYYRPPVFRGLEGDFGKIFGEIIPRLFLDRTASMNELNRWTAKKAYADEKQSLREHLRLNDGITPLASGLWARICSTDEKQPEAWSKLFPTNAFCPVAPKQRAFYGISHLNWREPIAGSFKVKDSMHPDETPQSIYAWMLQDLLE